MITRFKKVSVQNFQSFGNSTTEFSLDNNEMVMIMGDNRDVGSPGESRNGVGKTTIMNAIVYALFGKGIASQKADELVNLFNQKKMVVELWFDLGENEYHIRRGRKPNVLELFENGTPLTLDSMSNTDNSIVSLIGMDYEVFTTIYFMAPNRPSFMGMKPAEQRNIGERVLSLDTLTERDKALKAIADELTVDLKVANRDLENAEENLRKDQQKLERLRSNHDLHIKKIKSELDETREILSQFGDIDFDSIIKEHGEYLRNDIEIKEKENTLREFRTEFRALESNIESASRELERANSHGELVSGWDSEHKNRLSVLEENLKTASDVESLRLELSGIEECEKLNTRVTEIDREIKQIQRDIDRDVTAFEALADKVDVLEGGVCPECKQSHVDEEKIKQYVGECDAIETNIKKKQQSIDELEEEKTALVDGVDRLGKELSGRTRDEIRGEIRKIESLNDEYNRVVEEKNPYSDISYDIEELTSRIAGYKADQDKIKSRGESIKAEIESLRERNTLSDLASEFPLEDAKSAKRDIEEARKNIKRLEGESTGDSPFSEEIEILLNEMVEPDTYRDRVSEIEDDLQHIKYLRKLLTDNKSFIRRNILDQYIPYLNKKIVEYSQELEASHIAQINSDLTTEVEYMGRTVSFATLSAGEMMRVNLAVNAGFSDLLGMLGKGSSLLLVDELFDSSLDSGGMHKAFRFIKANKDNVLLVSHRPELVGEVDRILTIQKQNGFASIV